MNSDPKVSIVMPAYNVAPYIGETLESVFAQTFTDYEVIIVNDGSPDTEEFERALEPFRNRIRYLKQENRGAGAARNIALRAARGEYIAFLDADDVWLPHYLEEQIKSIKRADCDLICADAILFDQSPFAGKTFMELLMSTASPTGRITFLGLVSAEQSLVTSGVLARRQPIFNVGLFDESLRNSQDFDLWLRLVHSGARLEYHRRVLLRYRWHEGSLSGDDVNRNKRQLRVLRKIETDYDLDPAARKEVSRAIAGRRALLHFELGKAYLVQGEFDEARASFAEARAVSANWKAAIGFWASTICPRLIQAIYLRRTRKARERLA
jgi:glycosyltransferase involved in cell wall biosynthesis